MPSVSRNSNEPTEDGRAIVESPGPDESIVGLRTAGRALRIYGLAGGD